MPVITALETYDVRFPTSRELDGSDAMNPDPDYSAAYLVLKTDLAGLCGHGFVFTIGRGNDVQTAALAACVLEVQRLAAVLALKELHRFFVSGKPPAGYARWRIA